jgi:hypothetical protein
MFLLLSFFAVELVCRIHRVKWQNMKLFVLGCDTIRSWLQKCRLDSATVLHIVKITMCVRGKINTACHPAEGFSVLQTQSTVRRFVLILTLIVISFWRNRFVHGTKNCCQNIPLPRSLQTIGISARFSSEHICSRCSTLTMNIQNYKKHHMFRGQDLGNREICVNMSIMRKSMSVLW